RGILERLDAGEVVIGDGGFVFALEKRGYVKAGVFTPEVVVEFPEAVRQLHFEFLRAGADVMQTYNFYASEDKLQNRANEAAKYGLKEINESACRLAREVANRGDALVAGGICLTPSYMAGRGKEACQSEFQKQVDILVQNKVDFLIGETFNHVEEAVWATEVCKSSGLPVAMCLNFHKRGDFDGVPLADCAVQIAQAGADIIGYNCHSGPDIALDSIRIMKEGLDKAGIKKHLLVQPLGYHTPDIAKNGIVSLPEFPLALEPRTLTRFDVQKYAREAYNLGVRYIGGCCGFEAYHIRAIAEELSEERGKLPAASTKHGMWGENLRQHTEPCVRARACRSYWENLQPSSGRPYSAALSKPSTGWVFTAGHEDMQQHKAMTSDVELEETMKRSAAFAQS
ncbi:hypothetical protein QZH41_016401, partial [Actinostola sp. cb2023]